jgi:hypothetical protein
LRFDYQVLHQMSSTIMRVEAYRTARDLAQRRHAIIDTGQGGEAAVYLLKYNIRSLVGPNKYHVGFECSIDLLAGGNFPFTEPIAHFISRPFPWNPHVLRTGGSGLVCLGSIWSKGRTLLAHVAVHIAKLLNWDEPLQHGYRGWAPNAVSYWERVLKRTPITPGLAYPVLPSELTHGIAKSELPLFERSPLASAANSRTLFRRKG